MKWELLGKETVIIEDIKFHVGAKWLPAIKEKSGFSRKLKINNQLITSGTTMGCIIDEKNCAQIVNCEQESMGMPLLAPAFFGEKNALYFAKVSDELYWVVSYDNDGCIDIASDSDSVKELYPLRDYIREVVELSDASATFKVINIGERVYLDDPTIDARVEHRPLTDAQLEAINQTKHKVKRQAGNLKQKLYVAGALSVAGVGFLVHTLVTSIPDEIIEIQDGEHSRGFNNAYNKVKKEFNTITTSEKNAARMSNEKVVMMGKEQFNDYILSRGLTNSEVVETSIKIREVSPVMIAGWTRDLVEYKSDKFLMSYSRVGEHPISSSYKELDEKVIEMMKEEYGLSVSPVSLSQRGDYRTYDVLIEREQQEEYSNYLAAKRTAFEKKSKAMALLRQTQQELDSSKREIENVEDSVNYLGIFDRRDDVVIDQIVNRIEVVQKEARPTLDKMKKAIEDYNGIEQIMPPEHKERLLSERGIENSLFPVFQSTAAYTWSSPAPSHSFPTGIADDGFEDAQVIKGSTIELNFKDGVFGVWAAKELLEMPYIFVDGMTLTDQNGQTTVKIKISINELNQDYIF